MRDGHNGGRPLFDLLPSASITGLCMMLSTLEREWASVVGDALARRTAPKAFDGEILIVAADSQAVMHDLNFKKNSIIRAIRTNARIGVSEIRAELGRVGTRQTRRVSGSGAARRKEVGIVDDASLEAARREISSAYPDMPEELAESIARCRIIADSRF